MLPNVTPNACNLINIIYFDINLLIIKKVIIFNIIPLINVLKNN